MFNVYCRGSLNSELKGIFGSIENHRFNSIITLQLFIWFPWLLLTLPTHLSKSREHPSKLCEPTYEKPLLALLTNWFDLMGMSDGVKIGVGCEAADRAGVGSARMFPRALNDGWLVLFQTYASVNFISRAKYKEVRRKKWLIIYLADKF